MPEYLHPGVYIEEIEWGPKHIEGVPTSTAALIGETERGPTEPRAITSYKERWFGGVFGDTKFMPYAVSGFFENGGKRLYVARITDDASTPAEAVLDNFTVRAVGPGSWSKRVFFRIVPGSTTKPGADGKPLAVGFRLLLACFASTPTKKDLAWFDSPRTAAPPTYFEIFDDLETDETSPNYWDRPEAADYQKQILDRWWPLINAQDPLSLKAKVVDSEAQYSAAKASTATLLSKRTETLLAKMDELDAGNAPAPVAAAGGS